MSPPRRGRNRKRRGKVVALAPVAAHSEAHGGGQRAQLEGHLHVRSTAQAVFHHVLVEDAAALDEVVVDEGLPGGAVEYLAGVGLVALGPRVGAAPLERRSAKALKSMGAFQLGVGERLRNVADARVQLIGARVEVVALERPRLVFGEPVVHQVGADLVGLRQFVGKIHQPADGGTGRCEVPGVVHLGIVGAAAGGEHSFHQIGLLRVVSRLGHRSEEAERAAEHVQFVAQRSAEAPVGRERGRRRSPVSVKATADGGEVVAAQTGSRVPDGGVRGDGRGQITGSVVETQEVQRSPGVTQTVLEGGDRVPCAAGADREDARGGKVPGAHLHQAARVVARLIRGIGLRRDDALEHPRRDDIEWDDLPVGNRRREPGAVQGGSAVTLAQTTYERVLPVHQRHARHALQHGPRVPVRGARDLVLADGVHRHRGAATLAHKRRSVAAFGLHRNREAIELDGLRVEGDVDDDGFTVVHHHIRNGLGTVADHLGLQAVDSRGHVPEDEPTVRRSKRADPGSRDEDLYAGQRVAGPGAEDVADDAAVFPVGGPLCDQPVRCRKAREDDDCPSKHRISESGSREAGSWDERLCRTSLRVRMSAGRGDPVLGATTKVKGVCNASG